MKLDRLGLLVQTAYLFPLLKKDGEDHQFQSIGGRGPGGRSVGLYFAVHLIEDLVISLAQHLSIVSPAPISSDIGRLHEQQRGPFFDLVCGERWPKVHRRDHPFLVATSVDNPGR
jgi:hypothetical protein